MSYLRHLFQTKIELLPIYILLWDFQPLISINYFQLQLKHIGRKKNDRCWMKEIRVRIEKNSANMKKVKGFMKKVDEKMPSVQQNMPKNKVFMTTETLKIDKVEIKTTSIKQNMPSISFRMKKIKPNMPSITQNMSTTLVWKCTTFKFMPIIPLKINPINIITTAIPSLQLRDTKQEAI